MDQHRRPWLKVAVLVSGIIIAALIIYMWLLRPSSAPPDGQSPMTPTMPTDSQVPSVPHSTKDLTPEIKSLLQGLDRTTYHRIHSGDFDYWPDGGLRNTYSHLSTYITYKLISNRFSQPVFLSGPHSTSSLDLKNIEAFGHYNPEFPRWLSAQLTEVLSDASFVESTKPLVEEYILNLGFLYFETYKYLQANPEMKKSLATDYQRELSSKSPEESYYWNISWWPSEQEETDTIWMMNQLGKDYDPNKVASAVYFWLRRNIDRTESDFFAGLTKFLQAYDSTTVSDWQASKKYKYPGKKKTR